MARYFHTTDAAEAILRSGFRDGEGTYGLASFTLRGVFLADTPVDVNEGASGQDVLEVILPDEIGVDDYELIEDMKPYREWCVPAALLNDNASVRQLTDAELDRLAGERWT